VFIYTHTEIIPKFIAHSAMSTSQNNYLLAPIEDLQLTAEYHI